MVFNRLTAWLFQDKRPDFEKKREREFILAANSLKTLSVNDRGGMSIDPEELREHITASREQLRHLVQRPESPSRSVRAAGEAQVEPFVSSTVEAPVSAIDCIEVVAWRRLQSGATVRYMCLQATSTGRFAIATASLFTEAIESLPSWVDSNTNRQIANALQLGDLQWYATVSKAMDGWDAEL